MGRRIRIDFVAPIHTDPGRADGILAEQDPATGFLHLDGRLTRTGVFIYADADGNEWGELRTEDEVFEPEALASFRMVVVTDDHPATFVDTRNVKDVQVGQVGSDVRREGDFLRASIVVTDAQTILAIQRGKTELSCGYTAELVEDAGVFEGEAYSARQTNIRGNHVAIVSAGRAGPNCRLLARGDGAAATVRTTMTTPAPARRDEQPNQENNVKLSKLIQDALVALRAKKVDEAKKHATTALDALKAQKNDDATESAQRVMNLLARGLELGDEEVLMAVLEASKKLLAAGGEEGSAAEPSPEDMDPEEDMSEEEEDMGGAGDEPMLDDAVALRARLDALESQRQHDAASFQARVDARVELVAKVRAICPSLKTDGASDDALMRAVVLAVNPGQKAKLDAHKKSPGYLKASYDAALELHSQRQEHGDDLTGLVFDAAHEDAEDREDLGEAFASMHQRRADRSRTKRITTNEASSR